MIDLAQKLKNEIYIISPHGEIAARRSPRVIDTEELRRSVKKFGKHPSKNILLTKYEDEPLLLSLSLCRSSGFLIAVIPYCTPGALLGYIDQSGSEDILISEELKNEAPAKRITQSELECVTEVFAIMRTSASYGIIPKANATDIMRRVSYRAERISDFVGCRINITKSVMFTECENFDLCFFEAFMFCFSALVRRSAVDRTAELGFFATRTGLAIRSEGEFLPDTEAYELDDIRSFAENNEMYFSVLEKKGRLCVELCPHRPDLSKLGLKNNDIFLE